MHFINHSEISSPSTDRSHNINNMAAFASLPESVRREFLECGLCNDEFDTPKVLPCLHTFCLGCLDDHISRSTTSAASLWFLCPACRAITDLPPSNTKGFRTNTFVLNLKRFAQSQLEKHRRLAENYSDEEEQQEREIFGGKSGDDVGELECKNGFKRHTVTRGTIERKTIKSCPCGGGETTFYCDTCEQLICPDCVTSRHKSHDIVLLEDKANRERDRFMNTVHNTRKEVVQLKEGISDLEKYKVRLRTSRNDAVSQVKQHASLLRKLIDQEEDSMLKNIDNIFEGEVEKTEKVIKENRSVTVILKSLTDFSNKLLRDGADGEIVVWSAHTEEQVRGISGLGRKYGVERIRRNPIDIRFKAKERDYKSELKTLLGETEYGVNIDILDQNMNDKNKKELKRCQIDEYERGTSEILALNDGSAPVLESRVHKGNLVRSFSAFTDGSHFSPIVVGIVSTANDDLLVVDKNNKCVKIFGPDGGMYRKIHGSDNLWGVTVLPDGNYGITDKTVHMFDTKGKLVKVLRQQPRNSHGIAVNSNGDIVVADCMSRCIYILSSVGGSIKRIITQRAKGPFKCPAYVAVNNTDGIVVSDCALHTVSIFNDKAQFIKEFGVAEHEGSDAYHLDCPSGICIDKLGNILVCDKNNDRVMMLDSQGRFICVLVQGTEDITRPQAVTIDSQGQLVVAEEGGRIKIFKYRDAL